MKVAIYGAGAIGGLIGSRLSRAGAAQVSAVARGATLAALQQHGWRLREPDGTEWQAPVLASEQAEALGPQDLVIVAVKGPAMAEVARGIGPLLGPDTWVLTAMNGVPWWFSQATPALADAPLDSVDPAGRIAEAIDFDRVLGAVVHASAGTPAPGLVGHAGGRGLIVGEPRGGDSERVRQVVALLQAGGFEATATAQLRQDLWYKLWGNLTMNPVSALTGATIDQILADPLVREFCSAAMREAAAIGERLGCGVSQSPEDRHQVTARLGAFRTSMLQDVLAGRPLELDAIVGAVQEMGRRLVVATPCIDALMGLTRLMARQRGLYPLA